MDPVEVEQLLLHEGTRPVALKDLVKHGFFKNKGCLKTSCITKQHAISMAVGGSTYHNIYSTFTGTVLYKKSSSEVINKAMRNLEREIVDLVILQTNGTLHRLPVIILKQEKDIFPLTIVSHVKKDLFTAPYSESL